MIPTLIALAATPWEILPPGIHPATFSEVEARFAINKHRREIFEGLLDAALSLRTAGCSQIYLDGSYVTAKPIPNDYDACWDPTGVDPAKLDPVFANFLNKRAAQKAKFKGEFFPSTMSNLPGQTFIEFFQVDRFSGMRKGLLLLFLNADPTLTRRIKP